MTSPKLQQAKLVVLGSRLEPREANLRDSASDCQELFSSGQTVLTDKPFATPGLRRGRRTLRHFELRVKNYFWLFLMAARATSTCQTDFPRIVPAAVPRGMRILDVASQAVKDFFEKLLSPALQLVCGSK